MTTLAAGGHDAYTTIARFYDLEYDAFEADLEFYRQFAERADGPMLELACGSGRVLRALTDLCQPLTGIDVSEAMLDLARQRLPDTVELLLRPMETVSKPQPPAHAPFALACVALNSFLHLPDADAQLATLTALRELMMDGGVLVLDIFAPDPTYLAAIDDHPAHRFATTLPDGARLDRWTVHSHDQATQVIETTVYFDIASADGTLQRFVDHYLTRYIYRFELEHLLVRAGWELVSLFGTYELDPYDSDSERMLVLATPTG